VTDFSRACDTEWLDDSSKVILSSFIEYFAMLRDVRTSTKTSHFLLEIIFTTVCAYICGANSWEGGVRICSGSRIMAKKIYLTRKWDPITRHLLENFCTPGAEFIQTVFL